MDSRQPCRLQGSGWTSSLAGEGFLWSPEESVQREDIEDIRCRETPFGASFSDFRPDDVVDSIVKEVWGEAEVEEPEDIVPKMPCRVQFHPEPRVNGPRSDGSMRRSMSSGPSSHALAAWLGAFNPPAPPCSTFTSERASGASFATSAWQSSVASFSSEACGERPDTVLIGRRGQPEMLSLSVMKDCPKGPSGGFLSLGSRLHEDAACTPCKFFRSTRGCRDGALCKLCHYPHEGETRSAIRRAVRRTGLEKRAFFDANAAQISLPEVVKNTFIHVDTPFEATARRRCLSL
mmetsp:Transcript_20330/g.57205  ORF Transcript_20330/g.57205 Transcript_20330/m.57205 type:complete len:291 (+) Transcript_20330:51-923(+)